MFQKNKNLIAGIFIFLFSLFFFLFSFSIKLTNIDKMVGSRAFPQIVTVLMMILSAWLIISSIYNNRKGIKAEQDDKEGDRENRDGPKPNYINTVLVFACLAIYIFLLDKLGFIIATILYLFSQMYVLETESKKKIGKYVVISVITTFIIYFVFTKRFSLVLPRGILF